MIQYLLLVAWHHRLMMDIREVLKLCCYLTEFLCCERMDEEKHIIC